MRLLSRIASSSAALARSRFPILVFRSAALVLVSPSHSAALVWSFILRLSSGLTSSFCGFRLAPLGQSGQPTPSALDCWDILGLRLLSRRLTPSTSAHQRVLSRIWLSPGPGKLLSDYSLLARWLAGSPARLLASPLARWLVCSLARPLNRSIARSLG